MVFFYLVTTSWVSAYYVRIQSNLKAELWVETATEGGRRFMAAWRKQEEVDAWLDIARRRENEATGLGNLLSHAEA